jgi:GxxExxY protein
MPITASHPIRRLTQDEFGELAFEVMRCVFDIHNEFGRLFVEKIYKRELASRFPQVEIELPITIAHRTFSTTYYLDALVADGGPFEFKAVEQLPPKHRGQLYNYLLLLDLAHGKLVNLRLESVQHEFVNALLRPEDRHVFVVCAKRWKRTCPGSEIIADWVVSLLRDWGTGLEVALYEAALVHFLGGEEQVVRNVSIAGSRQMLGYQPMRLAERGVAFKITAFDSEGDDFEDHTRRLLAHTDLCAILWVNIGLKKVSLVTVER